MSETRLPLPRETLAGCIWLPRIIAKARRLLRGELPKEYADRFCHATGVDGYFLAHFELSRSEILAAAREADHGVEAWFLGRPGDIAGPIARWNEIAVNLGRPGYPMADRLPIAKASTYRHLRTEGMETVFEVLEADENA